MVVVRLLMKEERRVILKWILLNYWMPCKLEIRRKNITYQPSHITVCLIKKLHCVCFLDIHTYYHQRKAELTFLNRLLITRHGQTLCVSIFTTALWSRDSSPIFNTRPSLPLKLRIIIQSLSIVRNKPGPKETYWIWMKISNSLESESYLVV